MIWFCHVTLTMLRHLCILWLHLISGLAYETLKSGIKMQVSVMMWQDKGFHGKEGDTRTWVLRS